MWAGSSSRRVSSSSRVAGGMGVSCNRCETDADCADPGTLTPFCGAVWPARACVACRTDADCGDRTPFCSSTGSCIECRAALGDEDCPGTRRCGRSQLSPRIEGVCQICLEDADCPLEYPTCFAGICRAEDGRTLQCRTDEDCFGGAVCSDSAGEMLCGAP